MEIGVKMSDIKKIDPKFLADSGLLFKINRDILHPFGLALEIYQGYQSAELKMIVKEDDGTEREDKVSFEAPLGQVWDYRDDPEGMLYDLKTLCHGEEKLKKFMEEFGNQKIVQRKHEIGFVRQTEQNSKHLFDNEK